MQLGQVDKPFLNNNSLFHLGNYASLEEYESTLTAGLTDLSIYPHKSAANAALLSSYEVKWHAEALKEVAKELPRLVEEFHRLRENKPATLAMVETPGYDVVGEVVDLGRFLGGEPEFMVNYSRYQERTNKMLDIKFRMCQPKWLKQKHHWKGFEVREGSKYVTNGMQKLFSYYLPILDMIDNWEQSGIRCRIIVDFISGNAAKYGRDCNQLRGGFVIKDYGQNFDLETFVRVFATRQASQLECAFSRIFQRWGETKEKNNYWSSFDCSFPETECRYNPEEPTTITIPSPWHAYHRNFEPQTGEELLKEKGYPIAELFNVLS